MSILELLKMLRRREQQLSELREKISLRRDAATNITAKYGENTPGGTRGGDRMPNYAAQIDELNSKIKDVTMIWQAEMAYCVNLCDRYEGVERMLIYNYYGKAWTLRAVAAAGGYSEGYCRKVKARLDDKLRNENVDKGQLPDWYTKKERRYE